jgi:hypothetical protein
MFYLIAFAALFAAFSAHAGDKGSAVFFRHNSTLYSESVPIKDFEDDLKGGQVPEVGHHTLTYNRLEMGFAWRDLDLAYWMREDYVFDYSSDTMKIMYWDKNKKRMPDGNYDVYLKAQHIKADGWRLGYQFVLPADATVKVSLNYLQAEDLLYGSIAGQVTAENGDIKSGDLAVGYYYEEDYILDRPSVMPAEGKGYSVDVEAKIAFSGGWQLGLDVYDFGGRIRWKDAPFTDGAIASTSTYYDSQGYARRHPMMKAVEGYRDVEQNLPLHYLLTASKTLYGPLGILYVREKYDQVEFDRLLVLLKLAESVQFKGGYDFTQKATWVGMESKAFSLTVATDDWSLIQANSLVLRAMGRWEF